MSKKPKQSPALAHVQHVWDNVSNRSWQRFNGALFSALKNAVVSGMAFCPEDFRYMADNLRMGRWIGESGVDSLYTMACGDERGTDNPSAIQAIETYCGREPFLWAERTKTPTRLHVGSQFTWKGEFVTVTSFNDAKKSLTAVKYKSQTAHENIDGVGATDYFSGQHRIIESRCDYADGRIAVRYSAPVKNESSEIERRFTVTAAELRITRLEYDTRRRKHEKGIAAARTLDDLEVVRKAAADEGRQNYRHFDIEIIQAAIGDREKAIQTETERAEYERQREVIRAREEAERPEKIRRWLAGEDVNVHFGPGDIRIRVKGDYVQTSNGHQVSIASARRALAFVKKHRKGWESNGTKFDVDVYPMRLINGDGVQIGCTRIPWPEVKRFEELTETK